MAEIDEIEELEDGVQRIAVESRDRSHRDNTQTDRVLRRSRGLISERVVRASIRRCCVLAFVGHGGEGEIAGMKERRELCAQTHRARQPDETDLNTEFNAAFHSGDRVHHSSTDEKHSQHSKNSDNDALRGGAAVVVAHAAGAVQRLHEHRETRHLGAEGGVPDDDDDAAAAAAAA